MSRNLPPHLRDYVFVAERIAEFYRDNPQGRITTEILQFDPESNFALVRAMVYRGPDEAEPAATGHSTDRNDKDALEKAETGAVGRALANLGYEAKRTQVAQVAPMRREPAAEPPVEAQRRMGASEPAPATQPADQSGPIPDSLLASIAGMWDTLTEMGDSEATLRGMLRDGYGVESRKRLTKNQGLAFGKRLSARIAMLKARPTQRAS